ncbi:MAG: hypothetical protein KID09_31255 [Paenibacillus macerans]|nr:hypothetical protein [Paenibacillus macerans]
MAIYTSTVNGRQFQALAYSIDNGRTFKKYNRNPALDINADPI